MTSKLFIRKKYKIAEKLSLWKQTQRLMTCTQATFSVFLEDEKVRITSFNCNAISRYQALLVCSAETEELRQQP